MFDIDDSKPNVVSIIRKVAKVSKYYEREIFYSNLYRKIFFVKPNVCKCIRGYVCNKPRLVTVE